jgi:hypothetical protein
MLSSAEKRLIRFALAITIARQRIALPTREQRPPTTAAPQPQPPSPMIELCREEMLRWRFEACEPALELNVQEACELILYAATVPVGAIAASVERAVVAIECAGAEGDKAAAATCRELCDEVLATAARGSRGFGGGGGGGGGGSSSSSENTSCSGGVAIFVASAVEVLFVLAVEAVPGGTQRLRSTYGAIVCALCGAVSAWCKELDADAECSAVGSASGLRPSREDEDEEEEEELVEQSTVEAEESAIVQAEGVCWLCETLLQIAKAAEATEGQQRADADEALAAGIAELLAASRSAPFIACFSLDIIASTRERAARAV